jgi:hypothetical protein
MSETPKHTPGPWGVYGDENFAIFVFCDDKDGLPEICEVNTDLVSEEQAMADAFLIAAAPDLLAALKSAVALCGEPGGPWNVPSDPGSWIAAARAAIAKAEDSP